MTNCFFFCILIFFFYHILYYILSEVYRAYLKISGLSNFGFCMIVGLAIFFFFNLTCEVRDSVRNTFRNLTWLTVVTKLKGLDRN